MRAALRESHSISSAPRALRFSLLVAAAGGVLSLLGSLDLVIALAGLSLLVIGTVISAPFAEHRAVVVTRWWQILSGGTLAVMAGVLLGLAAPGVGGVICVIGGAAALSAAVLALPRSASTA